MRLHHLSLRVAPPPPHVPRPASLTGSRASLIHSSYPGKTLTDLSVVVTGHRPPRLGLDYTPRSNRLLTTYAVCALKWIEKKAEQKGLRLTRVIVGMAQGWDQACGHAALINGYKLTCALPFDGHGSNWPEAGRRRHDAILAKADRVHVVSPGPYRGRKDAHKYVVRDRWMVEEANGGLLLALWDGSEEGGTYETVEYAAEVGVPIYNVWSAWDAFKRNPGVLNIVDPSPPTDAHDAPGVSGLGNAHR